MYELAADNPLRRVHPLAIAKEFWPTTYFCGYQRDIIMSCEDSVETYVVAGNKLGKDFVAGFIVLATFLRAIKCGKTCRIVTTSVAEHHLKVLWAEIARFIQTSRHPLLAKDGGPLVINHLEIRRKDEMGAKNPVSYLVGQVSKMGEGLAGHHAEVTLAVGDEASGLNPVSYEMFQGWAARLLLFGNANSCSLQHPFRKGIKAGDLLAS